MKKLILIFAASSSLFLSSCLKDEAVENKMYGTEGIQDVKLVEIEEGPEKVLTLDFSTKDTTATLVTVKVNTPPVPEDVTITLVPDTSLIGAYNIENGTSFEAPAASFYAVNNLSVTIPKGSNEGHIQITTKASNIASGSYALAYTIGSASAGYTPSRNYKNILVFLVVKNAYEADYEVTGFLFHPSAPRAIHEEKYMYTVSATRCEAGAGDLYGSNYYFRFDVSPTNTLINYEAVGATPAAPASGFMTADNPGGTNYSTAAPDAPGSGEWVSTDYNNTYDPATRTFKMHYAYAVGGNGQNTWTRQIYEKWVRH